MRDKIEAQLSTNLPKPLVQALLNAHLELKEQFYQEHFRPSELEGGRFVEAALRVIQELTSGSYTPIDKSLPAFNEDYLKKISNEAKPGTHASLRIHIPRALFTVYAIRNQRDVGHIGGDVNPNEADAYLIISVCDWVLAELIRLNFSCPVSEAQGIVDDLVERRIPIVQDFDGFPKILRTNLSLPQQIMTIAYTRGKQGFELTDLLSWLKPAKESAIKTALYRLVNERLFLHRQGDKFQVTKSGLNFVEENIGFTSN